MPPKRPRLAGARWRLLVHEYEGGVYPVAHDVTNAPKATRPDSEHSRTHLLPPNTEFDELVVGEWIHIEQMDTGSWWMVIGGVTINVRADRDGRTKSVLVEGPNDNHGAVEGAKYELVWNGHHDKFTGVADG